MQVPFDNAGTPLLCLQLDRVRFTPANKGQNILGWFEWLTEAAAKAALGAINNQASSCGDKQRYRPRIHHAEMGTRPMLHGIQVQVRPLRRIYPCTCASCRECSQANACVY